MLWGRGRYVFWQVPPESIDEKARPYLRTSRRRAQFMLSRLMGNLGVPGADQIDRIGYADIPEANDDPYRYYRWQGAACPKKLPFRRHAAYLHGYSSAAKKTFRKSPVRLAAAW